MGLFLAIGTLGGCSGSSGGITTSGVTTFDGIPVPGEITFEAVDDRLVAIGRAVSVYPGTDGRFTATIPFPQEHLSGSPLRCRITLRLSLPTESGLPVAFDYDVPSEKVVTLLRDVESGRTLHFAITQ
jgi:hypothetical protein